MNNEFTICSENSLCNYYLFHGFTMISQSILRIYYESITNKQRKNYESTLGFANILSSTFSQIYYDLSRIHLLFREFTMNSLFISRINNEFTFCYTWYEVHMVLREFTMTSPSISQMHYMSVNTL